MTRRERMFGTRGRGWIGIAGAVALCLASLGAGTGQAAAQNPFAAAYTVNEAVITHYDIAQRMRLLDALGASGNLRALAIEQLTEDRVKVQAARALGIDLPPGAIEAGVEEFASQRGITVDDVTQVLIARDIDRQTLDDFVEAGLLWREVVGGRFRARSMPSEQELDAALAVEATRPVQVAELAEIALPFEERGEEATFALADRIVADIRRGAMSFPAAVSRYSRSASAAEGGRLPPIPVANLPAQLRGQVVLMGPGEVTNPFPIAGGVAILRLVSLRETPRGAADVDAETLREGLRERLFGERITRFGEGYLQELMRDALIVEQ